MPLINSTKLFDRRIKRSSKFGSGATVGVVLSWYSNSVGVGMLVMVVVAMTSVVVLERSNIEERPRVRRVRARVRARG